MRDEAERVPVFDLRRSHAVDVPLGALLQLLLHKGGEDENGKNEPRNRERDEGECVRPDLGSSEAKGRGYGVGPLPILQHQPPVVAEGQVVTGGQVAQSEGLAPADVAPAPAVVDTTTR